jgi:uncharacterized Fe-S center protein
MDLSDFNLDKFKFKPDNLINEEIIEFFKEHEFNSLLHEDDVSQMKTWESENLKAYIIDNDENLEKLYETIKKSNEIVLDTETTSLDIIKAELV